MWWMPCPGLDVSMGYLCGLLQWICPFCASTGRKLQLQSCKLPMLCPFWPSTQPRCCRGAFHIDSLSSGQGAQSRAFYIPWQRSLPATLSHLLERETERLRVKGKQGAWTCAASKWPGRFGEGVLITLEQTHGSGH